MWDETHVEQTWRSAHLSRPQTSGRVKARVHLILQSRLHTVQASALSEGKSVRVPGLMQVTLHPVASKPCPEWIGTEQVNALQTRLAPSSEHSDRDPTGADRT